VDNLNKKGLNKGTRYCFCSENESISHLFFECVVAKVIWSHVSKFLGFEIEGVITLYVASKCEGPEKATRGGVNESQSKFLTEFGLCPKINPKPFSSNPIKTA
jgi:hypothetical protein